MTKRALAGISLSVFLAIPAAAQPAIYTTTSTGSMVNGNIYANKGDVYLSGGPQNCSGSGIPDGNYYFEVTDPSASVLLSSDGLVDRTVSVTGGAGVFNLYTGNHTFNASFPCGAIGIQLLPYANTPNNGGEYKVTVTDASCSSVDSNGLLVTTSGCFSKSDNFKTGPDDNTCLSATNTPCPPPQSLVGGVKYYDANHNGVLDAGEAPVSGVTIHITWAGGGGGSADVVTDPGGAWSLVIPMGTFTACEDKTKAPFTSGLWVQTGPLDAATAGSGAATASSGCWSGTSGLSAIGDLNFGNVQEVTGTKYYDTNTNGLPDDVTTIAGFKIVICFDLACPATISATTFTDGSGNYTFYLPAQNSTYIVQENLPNNTWLQTGPIPGTVVGNATATAGKNWRNQIVGGGQGGLYFTNVCFVTTGALTMGWYKNAGNSSITSSDLATLVALNLSDGKGINDFNPSTVAATGQSQVKAWLGNATATNMAYMLSAQLAVMQLNVDHGFIGTGVLIYAPGTNSANSLGFATLGAVMAEANTLLGTDGIIKAGDSNRPRAGALETAIDNANNNLNIVGGGPCPFTTPY